METFTDEPVTAFPLQWPLGYPRAGEQRYGPFRTTFGRARDGLLKELQELGATQVVISTNHPLRKDGLPYAGRVSIQDSGVAVYFTLQGQPTVFCCDAWAGIEANLQALHLTIHDLRMVTKRGVSQVADRVYQGFKALPPGRENGKELYTGELGTGPAWQAQGPAWYTVFALPPTASWVEVQAAYKQLIRKYHPDTGPEPDTDKLAAVRTAYYQAKAALEGPGFG